MNFINLSPLRYPGSKNKIAFYLGKIVSQLTEKPNVLVEPFVGGGSVSLYFLDKNLVDRVIIADKDKLIYSFWQLLFNHSEILKKFVKDVKITLPNFYRFKEIARNSDNQDQITLAKACLFLNRTSFSGILQDGTGPIGGKEQKSQYKIDCRFNRDLIIKKIEYLSRFQKRVIVVNKDWKDTIEFAQTWANKRKRLNKLVFYFDPPFYYEADRLYRYCFDENAHKQLCEKLTGLQNHWLLSYDNVKEIKQMYSAVRKKNVYIEMPYSVNSHAKKIKNELIITKLRLPKKKTLKKTEFNCF